MEYKSINVLIVTYRQQEVIGRAIESALCQRDFGLNKIIICDDCSPDKNWEVIQSYALKYPEYITAYQNNPNLGIYGNSDRVASLHGEADLFCWLEGDDALEPGVFRQVQEYIANNNVNLSEAAGIFCNYTAISPSDKRTYCKNELIESGRPLVSLFVRGLVSWRASFFTQSVINKFRPTILDKGLALAELMFDSQWFTNTGKAYYCDAPGSIYYTEIGVSINLGNESDFKKKEALTKWEYFLNNNMIFDPKDRAWYRFKILQAQMLICPSLFTLIKAFLYFIKGTYPEQKNYRAIRSNFAPMIKCLSK